MELFPQQRRDAELRRLQRVKGTPPRQTEELGGQIVAFFKTVEKRQKKLGKIAEIWEKLVPQLLLEHCALESLTRGTLTVLVDSSAHLYDLKQLLLAGLEKQLLLVAKATGLRKITLKPGQWYAGVEPQDRRVKFD
jgi:hypothetical protein